MPREKEQHTNKQTEIEKNGRNYINERCLRSQLDVK